MRQTFFARRTLLLIPLGLGLLGAVTRLHPALLAAGQARRALAAGQPAQAAALMAQAAEWIPWHGGWWEAAGRAALEGGEARSAVSWLEIARAREGLSTAGLAVLGDAYEQIGDFNAALRAWEAAEGQGGPTVELAYRQLEAHRRLGDWAGMTNDLQALAALQPGTARLRYDLGLVLAAREPQAALAHLTQAAELDPVLKPAADLLVSGIQTAQLSGERAYTLLGAGRALASLSEWELAAEAFRQAVLARPDYAEAWAFLAEARQHLPADEQLMLRGGGMDEESDGFDGQGTGLRSGAGEPVVVAAGTGEDPALEELKRALVLDPKSLSAHLFLALYWQRQDRYDLALEALRTAARLAPRSPAVQVELGNTLAAAGDLVAAQAAFEQAVAQAPRDPVYSRALAVFTVQYDVQVRALGLPAARQAVLLDPLQPASLDVMAQVLLRLNDPLSAQRFLQRALQIQANYAPAHLHLGWVHLLAGESRQAYLEFRLTQELAPGSASAEQAQRALENYFP